MSSTYFSCPFEDCPFSARPFYSEKKFFKKHLVFNHGFENLLDLAYRKGIVSDPYRYTSLSFVINKVAEICRVSKNW